MKNVPVFRQTASELLVTSFRCDVACRSRGSSRVARDMLASLSLCWSDFVSVFSSQRLVIRPFWRIASMCTILHRVKTEMQLTTRCVWESVYFVE